MSPVKMSCRGLTYMLVLALACRARCFYLPGLAPTDFCTKAFKEANIDAHCETKVHVHINHLDSTESLIPFEYTSFDFCQVEDDDVVDHDPVENLGQVVFGERLRASPYDINFAVSKTQRRLCVKKYGNKGVYSKAGTNALHSLRDIIHKNYMHQWVIDNMPVTWCFAIMESRKPFCTTRFPVGCFMRENGQRHNACFLAEHLKEKGAMYIFNHVHFLISYIKSTGSDGRIVRAQVQLASCETFPCPKDPKGFKLPQNISKDFTLTYSYSVEFVETDTISWASRWDYILRSSVSSNVHWFSIFISLLIVITLSVVILRRSLCHDPKHCSNAESFDHFLNSVGCTFLPGDLFRPPTAMMLLSVCVGSGSQILVMVLFAIVLACLGVLSPANRGSLTTVALTVYTLLGSLAGFVSAQIYKMMGGLHWKANALISALLVTHNLCHIFYTQPLPLGCRFLCRRPLFYPPGPPLPLVWHLSSAHFHWGLLVFHKAPPGESTSPQASEHPVQTIHIPQNMPKQKCLLHPVFCSLMGGLVPFMCIFVQLFYLSSTWLGQIYYMYGFILLSFMIMVVVCTQTSIIICYLFLRSENYRWWWRSFFSTGSSAFYVFLYSLYYFIKNMSISGALSYLIFFGYTIIIVMLFFFMTGTLITCLFFIRMLDKRILLQAQAIPLDMDSATKALDDSSNINQQLLATPLASSFPTTTFAMPTSSDYSQPEPNEHEPTPPSL